MLTLWGVQALLLTGHGALTVSRSQSIAVVVDQPLPAIEPGDRRHLVVVELEVEDVEVGSPGSRATPPWGSRPPAAAAAASAAPPARPLLPWLADGDQGRVVEHRAAGDGRVGGEQEVERLGQPAAAPATGTGGTRPGSSGWARRPRRAAAATARSCSRPRAGPGRGSRASCSAPSVSSSGTSGSASAAAAGRPPRRRAPARLASVLRSRSACRKWRGRTLVVRKTSSRGTPERRRPSPTSASLS
jgi:hypothetical protein